MTDLNMKKRTHFPRGSGHLLALLVLLACVLSACTPKNGDIARERYKASLPYVIYEGQDSLKPHILEQLSAEVGGFDTPCSTLSKPKYPNPFSGPPGITIEPCWFNSFLVVVVDVVGHVVCSIVQSEPLAGEAVYIDNQDLTANSPTGIYVAYLFHNDKLVKREKKLLLK